MNIIKKMFITVLISICIFFVYAGFVALITGKYLPFGFYIYEGSSPVLHQELMCDAKKIDCPSAFYGGDMKKQEQLEKCRKYKNYSCDAVLSGYSVMDYRTKNEYILFVRMPVLMCDMDFVYTSKKEYWAIKYEEGANRPNE